MVEDYLKEHGFGGLVNTEVPCGCVLGDLAPCCDEIGDECEAGYVHHCETCGLGTHLPGDPECECDVEGCPTAGGYCVSINREVHPREPDLPPELWITDAKLQDTVEFWYGVLLNEQKMTGVVKMITLDHHTLGVLIDVQVDGFLSGSSITSIQKLYWVTETAFIRIVGADGMSDANAPADFAAVKKQVEEAK